SVDLRRRCYKATNLPFGIIMPVRAWRTGSGVARAAPAPRVGTRHVTIAGCLVRSEGLEPPRFYSLPPQGSASTNSATSAREIGTELPPDRINGADVTNRGWGDKACEGSVSGTNNDQIEGRGSAGTRRFRQHLLDFDRNPVAIDQYHAAGDRQIVGEDLDLVCRWRSQCDEGPPAQA